MIKFTHLRDGTEAYTALREPQNGRLYNEEYCYITRKDLPEDYRLIVERRFESPSDPESHAGGSLSS
jgi:hypothetical protein